MRPRGACGLRVAGCKPVVKGKYGKYGNIFPPCRRIKAFPVLNHIVMVHLHMYKNFFFLWRFDPIPGYGLFAITLMGHATFGRTPVDK